MNIAVAWYIAKLWLTVENHRFYFAILPFHLQSKYFTVFYDVMQSVVCEHTYMVCLTVRQRNQRFPLTEKLTNPQTKLTTTLLTLLNNSTALSLNSLLCIFIIRTKTSPENHYYICCAKEVAESPEEGRWFYLVSYKFIIQFYLEISLVTF